MKAVVLTGYGDVDKLELRELPAPRVGPGELSVRVSGASINPIDWKIRRGELRGVMPIELPVILGRDASGEVIEAGPGARGFPIGARVMGYVQAAYAERVVAKAESWAIVPGGKQMTTGPFTPGLRFTVISRSPSSERRKGT